MAPISTTTSTSVQRTWADIVKGSTASSFPTELPIDATLKPSKRGERRCLCRGEVLVMLGHYGWIMTFDAIDHPDIAKTGGRVYVHKRDVMDGATLVQGDTVEFYLYVDDQGLGAERCMLAQRAPSDFNADAAEFVPAKDSFITTATASPAWNIGATEFVPVAAATPSSFNMQASVFVPSTFSSVPAMPRMATALPNMLSINPAFLSDDDSDDESSVVSITGASGNEADKESYDSDVESVSKDSDHSWSREDIEWSAHMDAVVLSAPLKSPRDCSADESTSVGGSESEAEEKESGAIAPPPGLSLPRGFRPPPGLELLA